MAGPEAEEDSELVGKAVAEGTVDRLAIGLSGLCLVHCLLSVAIVAVFASAASIVTNPLIHEGGLFVALVLGTVALGQGYAKHRAARPALVGGSGLALMAMGLVVGHGAGEVVFTIAGVVLLATGHILNTRARALRG